MKFYTFLLTLAQWCIARILEHGELPESLDPFKENSQALRTAYSELNVARGCGQTTFIPTSQHVVTTLKADKLAKIEGWMK